MRKSDNSEKELVYRLRARLASVIPYGWGIDVEWGGLDSPSGADAFLSLRGPGGEVAIWGIDARTSLTPRSARRLFEAPRDSEPSLRVVAAPYLSPGTRDVIRSYGAGYFDLTNNLLLVSELPLIFVEGHGADTNPFSQERPIKSLKGPSAARVVRALVDFPEPYTLTRLGQLAGVGVASVHRVVSLLEADGLVHREPRGPIDEVDWPGLLRRWAVDYAFEGSNRVRSYLEPRGALAFLESLAASGLRHAVTGALATARVAPSVPARLGVAYVEVPEQAAAVMGLREVEQGANVLLAEPLGDVAFERVQQSTVGSLPVNFAAPSQVAVDLLTMSGRHPVGGEELIKWLRETEGEWRRAP